MNNKEELEKYKKELAALEAKQQQKSAQESPLEKLIREAKEEEKRASDKNLKWMIIATIFLVPLAGIFIAFLIIPGLMLSVGIALLDIPRAISLPYNAIDFQRIAYIDNQFIVYGIDYDRRPSKQLVIFNSTDGKKWTKADISTWDRERSVPNLYGAGFSYFNNKCMLIGTDDAVLVAEDCQHWHYQKVYLIESSSNHIFLYPRQPLPWQGVTTTIAEDKLYVADDGLFWTRDGINWHQESVPCVEINNKCWSIKYFNNVVYGNNKLLLVATTDTTVNFPYYKITRNEFNSLNLKVDGIYRVSESKTNKSSYNNSSYYQVVEQQVYKLKPRKHLRYELNNQESGFLFDSYFLERSFESGYIIAENQRNYDNQILYTKDLSTNKWSYDILDYKLSTLTRGKDRFVGMTESSALVLVDGGKVWQEILVNYKHYNDLSYGFDDQFMMSGYTEHPILAKSKNGLDWNILPRKYNFIFEVREHKFVNDQVCKNKICMCVGGDSLILLSTDGANWQEKDFVYKNSKPHWWRRFINFRF